MKTVGQGRFSWPICLYRTSPAKSHIGDGTKKNCRMILKFMRQFFFYAKIGNIYRMYILGGDMIMEKDILIDNIVAAAKTIDAMEI